MLLWNRYSELHIRSEKLLKIPLTILNFFTKYVTYHYASPPLVLFTAAKEGWNNGDDDEKFEMLLDLEQTTEIVI